jgi:cell division septum initiation protein DivIVA
LPLTNSPATIDDFRFVISNLQKEVEDLKQRVEILENEKEKAKSSWINRVFKT